VVPRERQKDDKQGQQDDRERMKRGAQDPGSTQRKRQEPDEGAFDDEGEQEDDR
jgi:hypothetical protein